MKHLKGIIATGAITLFMTSSVAQELDKQVPDTGDTGGPESMVLLPIKALLDENPKLLWEMLPASYQKDLNGLVHQFAENMDSQIYDRSFRLLKQIATLVRNKKRLIVEMIPAEAAGLASPEEMERGLEDAAKFLEAIVSSDIATIDSLKSIDLGTLFTQVGGELMKMMAASSKMQPNDPWNNEIKDALRKIQVEMVSRDGDTATIRVTGVSFEEFANSLDVELPAEVPGLEMFESGVPGLSVLEEGEQQVVLVEGKWMPKELASGWAEGAAAAREGLTEGLREGLGFEEKKQVLAMIDAVDKGLGAVSKAKTKEQFELALMGAVMGVMMSVGGEGGFPGLGSVLGGGQDSVMSGAERKEVQKLAEGEIRLTNGDVYKGDVVSVDRDGVVVQMEIGGFSKRSNWMQLDQESLKKIQQLGHTKDKRFKNAALFAEPFIEPAESEMEVGSSLEPATLRPPDFPEQPRRSNGKRLSKIQGMISGGGGVLLGAIILGNLITGLGVASFKGASPVMVSAVSLIPIPMMGPVLFLSLPAPPKEEEPETEVAELEAEAPAGASLSTGGAASSIPAAGKLSLGKSVGPKAAAGSLKPQSFHRRDTKFDRAFFQNNFPSYFKMVLGPAEKGMVLSIKTGKRELVGQRITRISGNDLHLALLNGREQQIGFSEIGEVNLRPK